MTRVIEVYEYDGPRGGEYLAADVADGRTMFISRKVRERRDRRVWLGNPDDPSTFADQDVRGLGTVPNLLDEWRSGIAFDPEVADLYFTLRELEKARDAR